MNLVKLQDDLKMLPMAALQSKAQGQDPSVPPWLATSVLNERMDAQKKAGLAQGAKENQPSIAEQLTQKAGLMALQGQQQKQAQQQMMQQMAQAPQPAPEGVPQPDMQPQEEQMMAQGGLARLPVNPRMFDYRAGGIIRFANEGDVPESDEDKEKKQTEADRAAIAQLLKSIKGGSEYAGRAIADIASIIPRGLVGAYDTAVVRPMKAAGINASYLSPMLTPKGANADSATPFTDIARKRDAAATVQQGPSTTPEAEDMGARDRGLTSIAPKTAPPVAPQPAPQPGTVQRSYPTASSQNNQPADQAQQPARTGLASLQPVDALAEAQRFTTAMPSQKEPTLNDTRALRQQALRDAGLPEDVGATLKEGVGRYEAESDRIRKERKYADAIYALSAETGGLGGIAQRSAERAQINATADAIRNDKANEMRTAMEAARRAEAMGDVAEVRRQMDLYNKANEEKGKAMVTAATNISNQQTQTQGSLEGERLRNVSAEKIAKLQRDTQILMHNTPAAQRPTVEENAIRDFMKAGLSYSQAYEKVKQIGGEVKRGLTYDQASDNAQKILDNPMYMMQIQKEAKAAGKPAPSMEEVHKKLISDALNDANNYKPSSGTSPATSTPQPTMTAAQAAALAKYGAK